MNVDIFRELVVSYNNSASSSNYWLEYFDGIKSLDREKKILTRTALMKLTSIIEREAFPSGCSRLSKFFA